MTSADDLQPPSIQDGPWGIDGDSSLLQQDDTPDGVLSAAQAQSLARDSFTTSTNWLDASRRQRWAESLRMFQSLHPLSSKYLSNEWKHRSKFFRPKSRSLVRRAEAETVSAYFSNNDVVSITAVNDDDHVQMASAAALKELVQYHCTHSIPWLLTVVGGRQDCEVMGIAVAKCYWRYEEVITGYSDPQVSLADDGTPIVQQEPITRVVCDKPAIDLLAPENIRVDPGCDWRDPVNTSAYFIELIPMHALDVEAKMNSGEWNTVPINALYASSTGNNDVTRQVRESGRLPSKDNSVGNTPQSYRICWIRANIVAYMGQDWFFYTGGEACLMLTDPVPLHEVFLGGQRPYVAGTTVVETHKAMPSSKLELFADLQGAANDQMNLRFDNVKMALMPRQFVKAGSGVNLQDVRNFMPGKTVLLEDPRSDIVWDRPPDATSSSYEEQDRINVDFDELSGDQTQSGMMAAQLQQQSATGQHLVSGMAAGMNEYELRLYNDTFVQPIIRKLIMLIQAYEDDQHVLALCAKNAKLFQRFGVNAITDDMLLAEINLKVNAGTGATNPAFRLKNLSAAADTLGKIFGPTIVAGLNAEEVISEVFAACGYEDGDRFIKQGFDPAQVQQQQQQKPQPQSQQTDPAALQAKVQMNSENNQTKLQLAQMRMQAEDDAARRQAMITLAKESAQSQRQTQQMTHDNAQQTAERNMRNAHAMINSAITLHGNMQNNGAENMGDAQ